MTNKDKVIAAFLVSIGMFAANCSAAQYVNTLSDGEKVSFLTLARSKAPDMVVLNSSPQPVETDTNDQGNNPTRTK
jgi:hypothetical protein